MLGMPSGVDSVSTSMGFDFKRPFQLETRRLLWLIGAVFATIVLFQRIELPGDALWSVFSQNKASNQILTNTFLSKNATVYPVLKNDSSSRANNEDQYDPFSREVPELIYPSENHTSNGSLLSIETSTENIALPPLQNENCIDPFVASPPLALSPSERPKETITAKNSSLPTISIKGSSLSENITLPVSPFIPTPAPVIPRPAPFISKPAPVIPRPAPVIPRPEPVIPRPEVTAMSMLQQKGVLTVSDMNELLIQSHLTPSLMIPRWSMQSDRDLVAAKSQIETAPPPMNNELYAPLYNNASMFQRSYELMEQMLKVYIYQEGDRRIFHKSPLEGIYASEGWFMKLLEANKHFVTKRPEEAHLFYLPFSSRQLEEVLYVPNSHSRRNMVQHLKDYLDTISAKYPFWNRTNGADHFLVACHDWAPAETKRHMSNCIRALCNADVKEGFHFGKDVSLPETYVRQAKNPLRDVGGRATSKRKTLAFYAGNMHGYLRPVLIQHWGNNIDPDMRIFTQLPHSKGNRNYIDYMKSSKYCICPRGYEVNSPRVVEAIFYECVPVIISDNFIPPFFETLNWESFAVFVAEKDVPNLKNILLSIPKKTYFRMQMRVKKVQQHFLWHPKPVKYDLFHMILHSIWYNRVFQFGPR